ncbi:hypothetical protein CBER1_10551 [Cercospora berteroae]|uniref:Uncharacterized protein n=1 Tax=Cercospora berteroae TaxID=357750 RepID=A0A2S6CJ14_9PEZI|nr:hypothetical protein CBER1_10551 [Cercospora berteroae]
MQLDTIRDDVMYWLEPMDALNLRLTCRSMIPTEDMPRYTSVFKYIIPNRGWLCRKMKEGYNLTIISEGLKKMMQRKACITSEHPIIDAFLVVTRNERLIACTEDFLPTHLFAMAANDGTESIHHGQKDHVTDTTRTLSLRRFGLKINLTCRTAWFNHTIIICPNIKAAFRGIKTGMSPDSYDTAYAHMNFGTCQIQRPVSDRCSFEGIKARTKTLFTTVITREDSWLPFIFRFDMPQGMGHEYTLLVAEYGADVIYRFKRR